MKRHFQWWRLCRDAPARSQTCGDYQGGVVSSIAIRAANRETVLQKHQCVPRQLPISTLLAFKCHSIGHRGVYERVQPPAHPPNITRRAPLVSRTFWDISATRGGAKAETKGEGVKYLPIMGGVMGKRSSTFLLFWGWLGMVGWLDGCMVAWLHDWMVGWLDGCMTG